MLATVYTVESIYHSVYVDLLANVAEYIQYTYVIDTTPNELISRALLAVDASHFFQSSLEYNTMQTQHRHY